MTSEWALKVAIRLLGGEAAVGKIVNVTRQSVAQWSVCPSQHVLALDAALGKLRGAVNEAPDRFTLRPDLYKKRIPTHRRK